MIELPSESSSQDGEPLLFSPIRLNADHVSTEKMLACYSFFKLFFPGMGQGLVKTLMDMEVNSERLVTNCPPEKRKKLIHTLHGLSMNMQFAIRDEEQKVMEFSIRIVPSEVMKRAQQGHSEPLEHHDVVSGIEKLIAKEVYRRFTAKLTDVLRVLANICQVPSFIESMLEMRWIDRSGKLLKTACIDDLLRGKYRDQFEQLISKELLEEGLRICETIDACLALGEHDIHLLTAHAGLHCSLRNITIQETGLKKLQR